MSSVKRLEQEAYVGGEYTVFARDYLNGSLVPAASIASVDRFASYRDGTQDTDGTSVGTSGIQSALQLGNGWDKVEDPDGYNFTDEIPNSVFTKAGLLRLVYKFTTNDDPAKVFFDVFEVVVVDPLAIN